MAVQEKLLSASSIREVRSALYGMDKNRQIFELNTALQKLYLSSECHISEHRDIQAIYDLSRMAILEDVLKQIEARVPRKEVSPIE